MSLQVELSKRLNEVLDQLRARAIEVGVDVGKAREQLRLGTRILMARAVWRRLTTYLSNSGKPGCRTQLGVALELGCDAGAVSRGLNGGQLSLESLAAFMTQLRWNWEDLGVLPSPEGRARCGYRHLLRFVRARLEANSAADPKIDVERALEDTMAISTVDFISLVHLYRSDDWLLRHENGREWQILHSKLRGEILIALGEVSLNHDALETPKEEFDRHVLRLRSFNDKQLQEHFERLQKDWGRAYITTVALVEPPWRV